MNQCIIRYNLTKTIPADLSANFVHIVWPDKFSFLFGIVYRPLDYHIDAHYNITPPPPPPLFQTNRVINIKLAESLL